MKRLVGLVVSVAVLAASAGCSVAISGAAAVATNAAVTSAGPTLMVPSAPSTSRPAVSTSTTSSDVGAAAQTVTTTSYTDSTTAAPTSMIAVDADFEDCFMAPSDVDLLLGAGERVDAVALNTAPYDDGTADHYCSYDQDGEPLVFLDVLDPVGMSAESYVHLDEDHSLSGVGQPASYDRSEDGTSMYIAAGDHVIVIDTYARPSADALIAVGKAALVRFGAR